MAVLVEILHVHGNLDVDGNVHIDGDLTVDGEVIIIAPVFIGDITIKAEPGNNGVCVIFEEDDETKRHVFAQQISKMTKVFIFLLTLALHKTSALIMKGALL